MSGWGDREVERGWILKHEVVLNMDGHLRRCDVRYISGESTVSNTFRLEVLVTAGAHVIQNDYLIVMTAYCNANFVTWSCHVLIVLHTQHR